MGSGSAALSCKPSDPISCNSGWVLTGFYKFVLDPLETLTLANGWLPVAIPLEVMAQMIPQSREMVKAAGRDPAAFEIIMGAFSYITPQALDANRQAFTGSFDQVKADIDRVRDLGVNELYFGIVEDTADNLLTSMERLRHLV